MSIPRQKWVQSLKSSSLVRPPPQELDQRQTEILAYVELFAQFASEAFGNDISELVRSHYPHEDVSLLDDVLAMFILHHPEHGHAILHALLSCIIDGTVLYDKKRPPFRSFISLFSPSNEHLQKELSEQWALACGEILRVLTHYNRPIYQAESSHYGMRSADATGSGACSSSKGSVERDQEAQAGVDMERKTPTRLLTPWITDSLLAAPLGVKSDYFRWCGGVMGKYAAGGELKPPTTVGDCGPGKHPQLMPSTPRWAVANGAAVILSVCDDELARYETADLTAAAVPALLLPPPATALDEHLVSGLPPLEPYARLFHRYYAIATPGATQRLFLGLLEAPPSWAPDALDAAVQLVELLRAAEDYSSSVQLPRNWLHLHFLRPVGTAMTMRSGIAADAAAALLFRVFSQPALLFPPPGHAQDIHGRQTVYGSSRRSNAKEQIIMAAAKATEEATARGIASLMCDHGPDVEWQICTLWEAAYGLLPLNSSTVNLPELVVATPLQPPSLSWNLFRPLVRVLEYLPVGSPSESCLLKIFTATVKMILHRTFPTEANQEQKNGFAKTAQNGLNGFRCRNIVSTELRAMVHSLFTDACPSADLAARLLSVAFTVCLSHDAVQCSRRKSSIFASSNLSYEEDRITLKFTMKSAGQGSLKERGAVSTFDSYIVAAVCALACEVQLLSMSAPLLGACKRSSIQMVRPAIGDSQTAGSFLDLQSGVASAIDNARRLLRLLEALLTLAPSSVYYVTNTGFSSPGEIVAAAVVAVHVSEVLGQSKACMHALTGIMRCTWEPKLSAKATTVLGLVEGNRKAVAAVAGSAGACTGHDNESPLRISGDFSHDSWIQFEANTLQNQGVTQTSEVCHNCFRESDGFLERPLNVILPCAGKDLSNVSIYASDVASLLCSDINDNVGTFIKTVLLEKEDLSVAAVPLLWRRLISAPELSIGGESTSAKRGWRQVVEALCSIALVHPGKATSAILLQAERDLQPLGYDGNAQEFQLGWRVNKRILCLLTELLRLHSIPEVLKEVAKLPTILERATDGMAVDGEACTMTQLELLEAASFATQVLLSYDSSAVKSLARLLKVRLPAVVSCLSHNSAHVRALSMGLLQNDSYSKFASFEHDSKDGKDGANQWTQALEQCLVQEIESRQKMGMPISTLIDAATTLVPTSPDAPSTDAVKS